MRQAGAGGAAGRATAVGELKRRLHGALEFDAESETAGEEEAAVEDLIEQIEDLNACAVPTRDARMAGAWELACTSSSITGYFGGANGLQRLLPEGDVGRIVLVVDTENGTGEVQETISFEMPIVGKHVEETAVAFGKLRATGDARQVWDPE